MSSLSNGTVPSFITPCGPSGMAGPQPLVNNSQVIEITFPGTPPYNLSRTLWHTNGTGLCSTAPSFDDDNSETFVLEKNTYRWTVENPTNNNQAVYFGPGDAAMFVAVERTAIPGQTQNNASSHYYYYSPNYTIYDTAFPSGRVPTSGTSMGMSLKAGMVLGMLALPAVLSIVS